MKKNNTKGISNYQECKILKFLQIFRRPPSFKPNSRANGLSLLPLALRPGLLRNLLLVLGVLVSCFIIQDSYSNEANAASITLTIPSDALLLKVNDFSTNNGFHKSEAATFSVTTDSEAGYNLTIKAKNADSDTAKSNDLINNDNPENVAKLSSITKQVSEEDFKSTGVANTWGFKPSKLNSSENTDFQPGPTDSEIKIDKTAVANVEVNNYDIILATKVNSSTVAGDYKNNFVFTATANPVGTEYNISYECNSGTPCPSTQSGRTLEENVTLDSTRPSKSNATFKGWCTASTSSESCSGSVYQPGGSYPLSNGTNITLYAMWEETGPGSCPKPVTTCSYNGVSGKRYGNSPCYMSSDATTYTAWSSASSYCPSGWSLPSQSDFNNLVSSSQAGSGACLYEQGWKLNGSRGSGSVNYQGSNGYYWSSTQYSSNYHYSLGLYSSSAYVNSISYDNIEVSVRCLHS